jgi:thiamine biosynthesis protein ThiS
VIIILKHYGSKPKKHETKSSTVSDLLSELSVNPETVLVRLNRDLVTTDTKFEDGDEIELISVVSGG